MLTCRACAVQPLRGWGCGVTPANWVPPLRFTWLCLLFAVWKPPRCPLHVFAAFSPKQGCPSDGGRRLLDAPVPSARPRLWWGAAVPFDAIYPLHIWLWEAAPSQPPQTNPSSRSPNRGQGVSCSAHSSHSNLAAEVQCLFLSRVMSRASASASQPDRVSRR